MITVHLN